MYVLIRKDLSKSQQAVQAGHAVAEFLKRNRDTKWQNGTLVYLTVKDEKELKRWYNDLLRTGEVVAEFREEDLDNQMTAIAVLVETEVGRTRFPCLRLM